MKENKISLRISDAEKPLDTLSRGLKSRKSNRVVTDTVHNKLRDAILSAELRPNKRLVEDEIAKWLEVSRTPVREALLRLEQEGLVERNHGWIVREYNPIEIKDRLECRLALEGYAARLACQHRSDKQLLELKRLIVEMNREDLTRYEFNIFNDQFHKIIAEAANNPTLVVLHAQTKMNYWDLSVPIIFTVQDDRIVLEQHLALKDAIEKRNGDLAEQIAREHVQLTMAVVLKELRTRYGAFGVTEKS
jgi:DNA-binding GntR family transcriptional regulator